MRSIDRHLDIYRQRQAAMDLAQSRQLLGELRAKVTPCAISKAILACSNIAVTRFGLCAG